MHKRTTPLVAAIAAAASLFAAATASAVPSIFDADLSEPATVGAFDGTAVYASGTAATSFTLKRSVDGGPAAAFSSLVFSGEAPTMDMGPGAHGTVAHPYGSPVAIFRIGKSLTTISAQTGKQVAVLTPAPAPTGDVSTYQGRVAYVAGTGAHKRIIVRWPGVRTTIRTVARGNIQSIELGKSQLAYVEGASGFSNRVRVHLVNLISGRDRVIDVAGSGEMSVVDFRKPAFTPGSANVLYAETRWGAGGQYIHKYNLKTGRLSRATGKADIFSAGWISDAHGLAYTTYDVPTGGCEGPCTVGVTGPLTFKAER